MISMNIYENRLLTFTYWKYPQSPERLASLGFYYSPKHSGSDRVVCYLCDLPLQNISSNIMERHLLEYNECPSVILYFKLGNDKKMIQARKETYSKFWYHKAPSSHTLAAAGFVLFAVDGKEDNARCLDCGFEYYGWREYDDPVEIHCSNSSDCYFVQEKLLKATSTSKKQKQFSNDSNGHKKCIQSSPAVTEYEEVDLTNQNATKSNDNASSNGKSKSTPVTPPVTPPTSAFKPVSNTKEKQQQQQKEQQKQEEDADNSNEEGEGEEEHQLDEEDSSEESPFAPVVKLFDDEMEAFRTAVFTKSYSLLLNQYKALVQQKDDEIKQLKMELHQLKKQKLC